MAAAARVCEQFGVQSTDELGLGEDREQLVEAARLQLKNGHRRLKMVVAVHKGGWQEDARRVRAVRNTGRSLSPQA